MGRLSNGSGGSDYGMLVTDASGNVIMSATGLGVNIVGTGNIKANNVTYPYGVNMTAGNFVLWSHSADVAGTLSFSAYVGVYHAGGAMGSPADGSNSISTVRRSSGRMRRRPSRPASASRSAIRSR